MYLSLAERGAASRDNLVTNLFFGRSLASLTFHHLINEITHPGSRVSCVSLAKGHVSTQ